MKHNTVSRNFNTKWFSEAIIYHILIDRFAGYNPELDWEKPEFIGGNIRGIIDKADYIKGLGINTIWLSPFYQTTAYHGYHITDFYKPDARFGSLQDIKDIISVFHKKNIRILLDFVPNHCSLLHPFFQLAQRDKTSKYRKWFYINSYNGKYLSFMHFKELPKFNLNYPEARNYIIGAAKYWISLGFDGLRLDHAIGPPYDFWKSFSQEIKLQNPETVLIGEAWLEGLKFRDLKTIHIRHKYWRWLTGISPFHIQLDYYNVFDGVLDFYFRHRITEYIAWKDNFSEQTMLLVKKLTHHYEKFPQGYFLPSFIDNHDMNRFLYDAGQNIEKLKTAFIVQISLPQPPIIYYGTETGLSHHKPVRWDVPYSDLQARKPMPWNDLNQPLINFVKNEINKRKKKIHEKI
jgi:glycosidase